PRRASTRHRGGATPSPGHAPDAPERTWTISSLGSPGGYQTATPMPPKVAMAELNSAVEMVRRSPTPTSTTVTVPSTESKPMTVTVCSWVVYGTIRPSHAFHVLVC